MHRTQFIPINLESIASSFESKYDVLVKSSFTKFLEFMLISFWLTTILPLIVILHLNSLCHLCCFDVPMPLANDNSDIQSQLGPDSHLFRLCLPASTIFT